MFIETLIDLNFLTCRIPKELVKKDRYLNVFEFSFVLYILPFSNPLKSCHYSNRSFLVTNQNFFTKYKKDMILFF